MSKFLQSQPNFNAVLDGSLALYGATIGAADLTPGFTVKTDASRHLYSTALAIGDTIGLQGNLTSLANKTQNITESKTVVGVTSILGSIVDASVLEALGLRMVQIGITPAPAANRGLLYSDTLNQLHYTTVGGGDVIISSGGLYLPLAGGTMTGSINMGSQEITNAGALRFKDTNIAIGSSSTIGTGTSDNVNIGNATTVGFGAAQNVLIGLQASLNTTTAGNVVIGTFAASTLGGYSTVIGQQAQARGNAVAVGKEAAAGPSSVVIGYRSSSGINADSVVLGHDNTSSGSSADIFGVNRTNNQANTLLLGNGAYTNIRANTTCDLGTAAVPFQSLYINSNVTGPTSTRAVDNITSCATNGVSGDIATFTGTAKVLQDSGVLLSSLLSSATAAATYLPLIGGTMFGNINLGTYGIGGGATANGGTCIGNNSNCGNNASVALGNLANAAGFGGISIGNASVCSTNNSLALGLSANNSAVGGVAIGRQCINSGIDAISIGTNANCSFPRAICIGTSSAASVTGAIALGFAANNSVANSLLVGVSANIRSTVTTCDLGTSALPFQTLYLNTSTITPIVDTAAALTLGGVTATSIAIGRAAVTTTVNGIFATALPFASWYSTTTYNPSFAAGVNRLTPPTAATAGSLVDFTHALGVLTYTGTRTRQFYITYNITFTAGTNGTNMTFFNSIAASTIIGTTQSQQRQQVTSQLASTQMSLSLSDTITLTTNQSVQLAGACTALSAAVGYNFISCVILAMPN